jgi:hypothetical protein
MVALTGIERATSQFSSVQLGLTASFYVLFVRRQPCKPRHGRLASSLGRHLLADSSLNVHLSDATGSVHNPSLAVNGSNGSRTLVNQPAPVTSFSCNSAGRKAYLNTPLITGEVTS